MTTAAAVVLDRDVTCLNCGYNLRGINPAGTCPECGMSISIALRQDHLQDAPQPWRRTVRLGTALVCLGTLISFPLLNIGPMLAAIGFWLVTVRQPQRNEPRHDLMVRIFARGTLIPGALGWTIIANSILYMVLRYRLGNQLDWKAYDVLFISFASLFGIGVAAMAQHLRVLAERSEDTGLVKNCQRLFWVWVAGGFVVAAVGGAIDLYAKFTPQWHNHWQIYGIDLMGLIAAAVLLLLMLWLWIETLRTSLRFRRLMKRL
ncbi:MAG: hypothetical protein IT445_00460 [Phycisphaeraceae bacterium]|nr:hypothetical protein [Phycisphaeraceae bacterium]